MTAIERTAYPRFKQSLTEQELQTFYALTEAEITLGQSVTNTRVGELSFAILLKTFQKLGYLPQIESVSKQIKEYIATYLGLTAVKGKLCNLPPSTRNRYRKAIRAYLGVKPYGDGGDAAVKAVVEQAALTMSDPADLINVAVEELARQQFELPAYRTLDVYVNHLRAQTHQQLYAQIMGRLSSENITVLDSLLEKQEQETRYPFNRLKQLPKSTSLKEIRRWEEHLSWLETLIDPRPLLVAALNTKIEQFAAEALQLETGDMMDIETAERRYTLLLCLLHYMQARTRDQLTTMYLKRIRLAHANAKERLRTVHDQHRELSELMVNAFAEVVHHADATDRIEDKNQDKDALLGKQVRQLLKNRGGTEKLKEECTLLQAYHNNNYLPLLQPSYRQHRAVPFRLTERLQIESTTQNKAVLQALEFVHEHRQAKKEHLPADISIEFASPRWQTLIREKVDGEFMYNRYHLEMCVFSAVAEHLRSGDLYVVGSEQYADYRTQLLSWEDCRPLLESYCQAVELPATAAEFVASLRAELTELSQQVDQAHTDDSDLYFDKEGKPHLRQLSRLATPENVGELESLIKARMPERHLLDILHNTHHWVDYTRHFGPPSGSDPKLKDAASRYLITVFGYGCNLGPAQTARHASRLVSARVLGRLNAQHITNEKLDSAIENIINEYARFSLPFIWGTGQSSIADGTHYQLYENNLLGERHIRYGGYGGIAHHHISDTYIALFSRFIACGVWEAVYILDGLIKNKSVLQPKTVHADTQGQSEVVFGLAHLLGIQLMPRMRNWNKVSMYRPDDTVVYQNIDSWFNRAASWDLLEEHWADFMQVILSIHTGKALSSWLLQKLTTNNPKNKLYLAFRELGRVIRTIFLLKLVSNPKMRREIYAASNKIESYNGFSGWIFFGGDGIIKPRDPIEYEKRIKYKDLIANAIMLQNVSDMTDVLHELSQEGYQVTKDAVATFSPYLTEHIKRFGEYFIVETPPPPLQPDKPFLSPQMASE
jgi:TnpA family transposase